MGHWAKAPFKCLHGWIHDLLISMGPLKIVYKNRFSEKDSHCDLNSCYILKPIFQVYISVTSIGVFKWKFIVSTWNMILIFASLGIIKP